MKYGLGGSKWEVDNKKHGYICQIDPHKGNCHDQCKSKCIYNAIEISGIFITGGLNEDKRSESQAFSPVGAYDCLLPEPTPLRYFHSQDSFLGKHSNIFSNLEYYYQCVVVNQLWMIQILLQHASLIKMEFGKNLIPFWKKEVNISVGLLKRGYIF